MTLNPLPARETQSAAFIPFTHLAGTDADVTAPIAKSPFDMAVDKVFYYNATGLAESAANFAAFVLQKPLIVDDIVLDTGNADLTAETVGFLAGGVAVKHGLETGDGPIRLTTTGAVPTGLAVATDYWLIRVDDFKVAFATTLNNAILGTKINLTGQGSGVNTLVDVAGTKRRLAWWSTNDGPVPVMSIPAATWIELTLNRSQARDVPKDTILEFHVDEEGTTNPPAGQGHIVGRWLK